MSVPSAGDFLHLWLLPLAVAYFGLRAEISCWTYGETRGPSPLKEEHQVSAICRKLSTLIATPWDASNCWFCLRKPTDKSMPS